MIIYILREISIEKRNELIINFENTTIIINLIIGFVAAIYTIKGVKLQRNEQKLIKEYTLINIQENYTIYNNIQKDLRKNNKKKEIWLRRYTKTMPIIFVFSIIYYSIYYFNRHLTNVKGDKVRIIV